MKGKKKKNKNKNPNSSNLVKKKKKNLNEEDQTRPNPTEETKLIEPSEKKKGQKLQLDSDRGALNVGLIMEMPLKT